MILARDDEAGNKAMKARNNKTYLNKVESIDKLAITSKGTMPK